MSQKTAENFAKIVLLIKKLRGPNGCPWDQKQSLKDFAPMILEEVHEVIEALDQENYADLAEELGDVLWDILFIANIAEEKKLFNLEDLLKNLAQKIVRRHPHVWGPEKTKDSQKISELYQKVKQNDYAEKRKSAFDGIAKTLPALAKTLKIIKKAEKAKIKLQENKKLSAATKKWNKKQWGEFLFQVSIIARKDNIDLEQALRIYAEKFALMTSKE